jgi:hypothetical protein
MAIDWNARHASADNLPDVATDDERIRAKVTMARRLFCVFAPTDAECDERVYMLSSITDPDRILAIVQPWELPDDR